MSHRSKDKFFDECKTWEVRLAGIEMEFSNQNYWQELLVSNKKKFYGTWAMECAEHLARVMQWYMSQGYALNEVLNLAFSSIIDVVPNIVQGKTMSLLIGCWKYGPEIQRLREEERPFK